MEHIDYDVIIVGGAMSGATLALALNAQSQAKMRIAVVEKHFPKLDEQTGFNARCIALSHGSCERFAQIQTNNHNLWQQIASFATPIKQIHVSDQGHSGIVEFQASEFDLPQLGAVVELSQMGNMLLQLIQQTPNIDYLCPVQIADIQVSQTAVQVQLTDQRVLFAPLVIGADGNQSQVASAFNIEQKIVRDYQQSAIIANVQVQQAHENRAFERFTAQGPLALLPMENNLMSLVWCVADPDPIMRLDDLQFLERLQQQFGWRLGKLQQVGKRFAYPLKLTSADSYIAHRCALVGNAAQTLHPIAGQGFNLGIRDVMALAQVLGQAYANGDDLGSYHTLQGYQQVRESDQQHIIGLTDGLVSLFANQLLPLQIVRNVGLISLAQSKILRQWFAKPTLGWV
ncbi:MAG: 2-octaprenyl-6-methoxyphenyl hydroxylase [Pasteurellaceae bacterium]|nr:2-octaprenyl-6-methoxyphenyl hydroxylase [Pasteurellaceae bacterium]